MFYLNQQREDRLRFDSFNNPSVRAAAERGQELAIVRACRGRAGSSGFGLCETQMLSEE